MAWRFTIAAADKKRSRRPAKTKKGATSSTANITAHETFWNRTGS
jgi:hypothetical protein